MKPKQPCRPVSCVYGKFESVEAQWRRKDGTIIAVRLSGRGVRDEREGTEIFEVMAKTSPRARPSKTNFARPKRWKLSELAGGVAHDFNNLFTVITGYTQILMDQHARNAQACHSIEQFSGPPSGPRLSNPTTTGLQPTTDASAPLIKSQHPGPQSGEDAASAVGGTDPDRGRDIV